MFNFLVHLNFTNHDLIFICIFQHTSLFEIDHLDFQQDHVSCSCVHVLTCPTNPWFHWERECFLNFCDSERVVFLNADVSQVCEKCVRSRVGALALDVDWDDWLSFTIRHRIRGHSHQVLLLRFVANSTRCNRWISCIFSDDTRIDVLHILPSVCFRVLTHTPCILLSESISLGLPRRHHQA